MVVCGISGRRRDAAVALAVDGRLVAAAEQAPLARSGGGDRATRLPLEAIEACLSAAGLAARDISRIVHAEGHPVNLTSSLLSRSCQGFGAGEVQRHRLSRLAAFAKTAQAAGARAVVAADGDAAMLVGADRTVTDLAEAAWLLRLAARLAATFGIAHDGPVGAIAGLEQLTATQEATGHRWFEDLTASLPRGSAPTTSAFERALDSAAAEAGAPLSDVSTPHIRHARVVVDVAHDFLSVLADYFGSVASSAASGVMLAGGVFNSPDFVARVQRAASVACPVAPCPTPHGAALGAALHSEIAPAALPPDLALGPAVSEADAKTVLENCRLDYIYEPRWPRLLERVSRLLERGKLIAWFQGRAEFGHPFSGSRSFLCDPSNRYARDNINVFLRQLPLATPIPLSLAAGARDCVDQAPLSSLTLGRTLVAPAWRDHLRGVADSRGYAHAHVVRDGSGPLADLLAIHQQRTGVPGLANLPLRAPDDVPAVLPRDAVRAAFASSADVLVVHRFLVMKDYWQMRDDATA